ncbi:MAG: sugar phosphate isomerase/epimerase [Spirochaetaceae bacterium]
MKFKTGILLDNLRQSFDKSLQTTSELGVDGIQIYVASHHMSTLGFDFNSAKTIKKKIESYNLELSALCGDLGGHGFEIRDENNDKIETTKKIIDFASELGTDIITTHIGVLSESDETRNSIIRDALVPICRYAEKAGIYIAIETGPEKSELLKSFIEETNEKHLKVNFDPANLVMVHNENLVESVNILKEYIVHTHLKDGKFYKQCNPREIYTAFAENNPQNIKIGDYFTETPLGEGDVDFPKYLKTLEDIGYTGYLTRECEGDFDRVKDITNGVKYIKTRIK